MIKEIYHDLRALGYAPRRALVATLSFISGGMSDISNPSHDTIRALIRKIRSEVN